MKIGMAFGQAGNRQWLGVFSQGSIKLFDQLIQALLRPVEIFRTVGMSVHNRIKTTAKVIEHHQLFGQHQQNIGRTDGIRLGVGT